MSRSTGRSRMALACLLVALGAMLLLPSLAAAETPQDYETIIVVDDVELPSPFGNLHWFNPTPLMPVSFEASAMVVPDPLRPVTFSGFDYVLSRSVNTSAVYGSDYVGFAPSDLEGGPLASRMLDVLGWLEMRPTDPEYVHTLGGTRMQPIEGLWWMHVRSVATTNNPDGWDPAEAGRGPSKTVPFAVDVTPPSIIETLTVANTLSPTTASQTVTSSVAHLEWPNEDYDVLSGVWGWQARLNGEIVSTFQRTEAPSVDPTAALTIEDLAVGRNVIEVAAVDWAKNVGEYRTVVVYVMPDLPMYITRIDVDGTTLPHGSGEIQWFSKSPLLPVLFSASPFGESVVPVVINGFEYALSRSSADTLSANPLRAYTPTGPSGGPLGSSSLDMEYWRGATSEIDVEGVWWLHARSVATDGWSSPYGQPNAVEFGYDITPPSIVDTVVVTNASVNMTVTAATARLEWPNRDDYDTLSGMRGWVVKLNGQEIRRFDRVMDQSGNPTATVSIESLISGRNLIEIAAQDVAGNVGEFRECIVYSNPVPPGVRFLTPAGDRLSSTEPISLEASAGSGPPVVELSISNPTSTTPITTFAAPPYSILPTSTLAVLPAGPYVLRAVATDVFGRSVEATKAVYWGSAVVEEDFAPSDLVTGISVEGVAMPKTPLAWFNTEPNVGAAFSTDPLFSQIGGRYQYALSKGAPPADLGLDPLLSETPFAGPLTSKSLSLAGWASDRGTSVEGIWFLSARTRAAGGWVNPYGQQTDVPFGYDITKPTIIDPITVINASAENTVAANLARLQWPNRDTYDQPSLSGVWGWVVKLNDVEMDPFVRIGNESENPTEAIVIEDLRPGRNVIEVAAQDLAGNVGEFRECIVYSNPLPPGVRFLTPAAGSLEASAPISLEASAGTGDPVVELFIDATRVATFTASPYSIVPSLNTLPAGTHELRAVATDELGRSATATKSVTWIPPVPVVSITAPTGGSLVTSSAITASVSSPHAIQSVTIGIDGTTIQQTFTSAPYSFIPNLRGLPAGTHTVRVSATSMFGTGFDTKTVTWAPPVPVVTITAPAGDALLQAQPIGGTVTSAEPVSSVEVLIDGSVVKTFTSAPYSYVPDLTGLSAGTHSLAMRAVSAYGTGSSLTKTVTWAPSGTAVVPGPAVSVPDLPGGLITSPASSGQRIGTRTTLSVRAMGSAGISSVTFAIDGVPIKTITLPSVSIDTTVSYRPDWSTFAAGNHTLTVTVRDTLAREGVLTRAFVLDKTPPTLSRVSSAPSIFYPRKRDGYRDYHVVKFSSSERVTAKLVIKNSKGTTIRTITKAVGAGRSSVRWNGKNSSGNVRSGRYRWYLQLTDVGGNRSVRRSDTTTIRLYQVVKTSSSTVRIVAR